MPRKGQTKAWSFLAPGDPAAMPVLLETWIDALTTRGYSERYVQNCRGAVSLFIVFCQERGVTKAAAVTKPMLERFQRWLFYYRRDPSSRRGSRAVTSSAPLAEDELTEPLSLRTQLSKLSDVKAFFKWLARQGYILANPASEIDLPKLPPRRPPEVLSLAEVEQVLAAPDLNDPLGVRDRAILETLYSTGVRRKELSRLAISDIDHAGGILRVRHGKGRKERVIPIGDRALAWIRRYLSDVRPRLAPPQGHDDGTLFLTSGGKPFWPDNLTQLARDYLKAAGIEKQGACHLFRHTMATLMLENGADIRFIQEMLGHATLHATTIYTHVAIKKLKQVHAATHPGASLESLVRPAPVDDEEQLSLYPPRTSPTTRRVRRRAAHARRSPDRRDRRKKGPGPVCVKANALTREDRGLRAPTLRRYACGVTLQVEFDREDDARWIAEIPALPGCMAYGATRDDALAKVEALALRVMADRLEHGEAAPVEANVSFVIPAA